MKKKCEVNSTLPTKLLKENFLNLKILIFLLISQVKVGVTHKIGVAHRALFNCVVRIGNLYGWEECTDNFLHNNSTMKVRMG